MHLTEQGYAGADNLEVMTQAVRYNAYLFDLLDELLRDDSRPVLDFGAGLGTFAGLLQHRGCSVTCVEPDEAMRSRLERMGLRSHASVAELPGASYGLIYSFNVLEHIRDDLDTLVQLRHQLAADGRLLLFVPAFQLLYSSMDRKVGHFRRYRMDGLTGLLRDAGYEVDSARYVDSLGFFASLVYRLVGRGDGSIDDRALIVYDRWVFPLSVLIDRLTWRWFGKNLAVVARPAAGLS